MLSLYFGYISIKYLRVCVIFGPSLLCTLAMCPTSANDSMSYLASYTLYILAIFSTSTYDSMSYLALYTLHILAIFSTSTDRYVLYIDEMPTISEMPTIEEISLSPRCPL